MDIQKRLQIEFEFVGDEQISGNTALRIINDVFSEAEAEQLNLGVVSRSKPIKEELIYNVSDQHIYIEQLNKGRLQDIDRYLDLTQTTEDKTLS